MGAEAIAQATCWGGLLIFSGGTVYFWFLAVDKAFWPGFGTFLGTLLFAFLIYATLRQ